MMTRACLEVPRGVESAIEARWQRALPFFKKRGTVVFVSDRYRFWESFGFVQQSLARVLVNHGVKVVWLDGVGWRPYHPVVSPRSDLLTVKQLIQLPGRRFGWIDSVSMKLEVTAIRHAMKETFGRKSLLWVQGGLDDRVAQDLDEIDVYSAFDDAMAHPPGSPLTEKANLILVQNRWAEDYFKKAYPKKTLLAFPPMELDSSIFNLEAKADIPPGFPKRVMGYIGTFKPDGFDMTIFETLVRELPHCGFLLAGRTDPDGERWLSRLKQYPNFLYRQWLPRDQIAGWWRALSVNLLLYRPIRANCGAFPVKVLEALYFGVPSIATRVPKTSSLDGIVPRESFVHELKKKAEHLEFSAGQAKEAFEVLYHEMHPKHHLAKVAEYF